MEIKEEKEAKYDIEKEIEPEETETYGIIETEKEIEIEKEYLIRSNRNRLNNRTNRNPFRILVIDNNLFL